MLFYIERSVEPIARPGSAWAGPLNKAERRSASQMAVILLKEALQARAI